jgi:hypothetical protein
MAFGTGKDRRTVEVINLTDVDVAVFIEQDGGNVAGSSPTLEPGEESEFTLRRYLPFTVEAILFDGEDVISRTSREFGRGVRRVLITQDSQGNLQLSSPDDPPPDVPPPSASLTRESLLAAISSSGLLGLALVGLLINRHD